MSVEECISKYVAEHGIKRSALGDAIGVSRQVACKMMRGQRKLKVEEYFAACEFLEVPYDRFVKEAKGESVKYKMVQVEE